MTEQSQLVRRRSQRLAPVLAALLAVCTARPAHAGLSPVLYRGRGTVSISPGPVDSIRGSVTFSNGRQAAPIGPKPPRSGTASLLGAVKVEAYPPNPCLGYTARGSITISWSDGTSSRGTFTLVSSIPLIVLQAKIKSGAFDGSVVGGVGLVGLNPQPEPPSCVSPFDGRFVFGPNGFPP